MFLYYLALITDSAFANAFCLRPINSLSRLVKAAELYPANERYMIDRVEAANFAGPWKAIQFRVWSVGRGSVPPKRRATFFIS